MEAGRIELLYVRDAEHDAIDGDLNCQYDGDGLDRATGGQASGDQVDDVKIELSDIMYKDEIVELPYTHPEWHLGVNSGLASLDPCVPYLVVAASDSLRMSPSMDWIRTLDRGVWRAQMMVWGTLQGKPEAHIVYQYGHASAAYFGRRADAWNADGTWNINMPPSPLRVYVVEIRPSPDWINGHDPQYGSSVPQSVGDQLPVYFRVDDGGAAGGDGNWQVGDPEYTCGDLEKVIFVDQYKSKMTEEAVISYTDNTSWTPGDTKNPIDNPIEYASNGIISNPGMLCPRVKIKYKSPDDPECEYPARPKMFRLRLTSDVSGGVVNDTILTLDDTSIKDDQGHTTIPGVDWYWAADTSKAFAYGGGRYWFASTVTAHDGFVGQSGQIKYRFYDPQDPKKEKFGAVSYSDIQPLQVVTVDTDSSQNGHSDIPDYYIFQGNPEGTLNDAVFDFVYYDDGDPALRRQYGHDTEASPLFSTPHTPNKQGFLSAVLSGGQETIKAQIFLANNEPSNVPLAYIAVQSQADFIFVDAHGNQNDPSHLPGTSSWAEDGNPADPLWDGGIVLLQTDWGIRAGNAMHLSNYIMTPRYLITDQYSNEVRNYLLPDVDFMAVDCCNAMNCGPLTGYFRPKEKGAIRFMNAARSWNRVIESMPQQKDFKAFLGFYGYAPISSPLADAHMQNFRDKLAANNQPGDWLFQPQTPFPASSKYATNIINLPSDQAVWCWLEAAVELYWSISDGNYGPKVSRGTNVWETPAERYAASEPPYDHGFFVCAITADGSFWWVANPFNVTRSGSGVLGPGNPLQNYYKYTGWNDDDGRPLPVEDRVMAKIMKGSIPQDAYATQH